MVMLRYFMVLAFSAGLTLAGGCRCGCKDDDAALAPRNEAQRTHLASKSPQKPRPRRNRSQGQRVDCAELSLSTTRAAAGIPAMNILLGNRALDRAPDSLALPRRNDANRSGRFLDTHSATT